MKHNEAVIRHAYDQAVTRLARLSLFAERGEAAGVSYDVAVRQEQLAIDDILHLAISLRRLIDTLSIRDASLSRKVMASNQSTLFHPHSRPPDLSLHDVLNKVIHSQFIEVFSFSFQLERSDDVEIAYLKIIDRERWRIPPLIAVRSDRGPLSVSDLLDLCKACDEILEIAKEVSGELSIHVGED